MVNKELIIFLPNDYPFKQPTFSIDGNEDITISELIDEWSPKFKIMEMIELVKKRLQQRN
jgi:ubiquitin-protein ligase